MQRGGPRGAQRRGQLRLDVGPDAAGGGDGGPSALGQADPADPPVGGVRDALALLGDLDVLAEPEQRGMVEVRPGVVAFRHELARRVVEEALPASTRMRLNARVLAALLASPTRFDPGGAPCRRGGR